MNCCSDWRSEVMFLVRLSNKLQIATFNRQLLTWSANIGPRTWWEIWWTISH